MSQATHGEQGMSRRGWAWHFSVFDGAVSFDEKNEAHQTRVIR